MPHTGAHRIVPHPEGSCSLFLTQGHAAQRGAERVEVGDAGHRAAIAQNEPCAERVRVLPVRGRGAGAFGLEEPDAAWSASVIWQRHAQALRVAHFSGR